MPVLAAIETEPESEKVIATANELATALETDLLVVHVATPREDSFIDEARAELKEMIGNIVSDPDSVTIRIPEEGGDSTEPPSSRVADAILRMASDTNPSYIVVGTRKQTPLGKAMLGSVAQTVLLNADAPVVTVQRSD